MDYAVDAFDLDPAETYLNHGSFGATPRVVRVAQDRIRDEIERNPHRFFREKYQKMLEYNRGRLAEFINCEPAQVSFLRNVTEGISTTLGSIRLSAGEEVLTTSHEYESTITSLKTLCETVGARLVVVDPVADDLNASRSMVNLFRERTRIFFISHITSSLALRFELASLVAEATRRGVLVVIDGAHGPGQVNVNIRELGADIYIGSLHKWAMFPRGSSFIAVSRRAEQLLRPRLISLYYHDTKFVRRFSWQGTFDASAWLVSDSVRQFHRQAAEAGWYKNSKSLSQRAELELCSLPGVVSVAPKDYRAPFVFAVKMPIDYHELRQRLREESIWVWTGCHNGEPIMRVSTFVYNSLRDVDRLVAVVANILGSRRRMR